uniref:hypothetical protein n=1 Tax=Candidatus Limisoma sp. TaxID=3076476 RepID=UPI0040274BB9
MNKFLSFLIKPAAPRFFARLALSFDNIGCGSEKENEQVPFFFDKTGCTSEKLK